MTMMIGEKHAGPLYDARLDSDDMADTQEALSGGIVVEPETLVIAAISCGNKYGCQRNPKCEDYCDWLDGATIPLQVGNRQTLGTD